MVPRPLAVSLVLLTLLAAPVVAHPHVWTDVRAEVAIAAGFVEGVWSVWTFDDVFSQLILSDHDLDGNGKLSPEESVTVKKGYFDNLRNYEYFTHLDWGQKKLGVPQPQNFQATVNSEGRIVYRFFLPLSLRIDAKTTLAVAFYDESFYSEMNFEKSQPVTLLVTDGGTAVVTLKKNAKKVYYGGQVTPTFAYIAWSPR